MAKKKTSPIQLLTELLRKNVPADERESITLDEDSVDRWFYFDRITDAADLEAAWGVFTEQAEIRRRLAELESLAKVMPGFGYRIPKKQIVKPRELVALVKLHLQKMRPLIADQEENAAILALIDAGPRVEVAPASAKMPRADDNELFMAVYEALQEPTYSLSDRGEHYDMLCEWAIYLTKCDEDVLYLLWPTLDISRQLPGDTAEAGMRLWALDCRDRYWCKNNDPATGIVYVRPPAHRKKKVVKQAQKKKGAKKQSRPTAKTLVKKAIKKQSKKKSAR